VHLLEAAGGRQMPDEILKEVAIIGAVWPPFRTLCLVSAQKPAVKRSYTTGPESGYWNQYGSKKKSQDRERSVLEASGTSWGSSS